jgi:hypothetical protein
VYARLLNWFLVAILLAIGSIFVRALSFWASHKGFWVGFFAIPRFIFWLPEVPIPVPGGDFGLVAFSIVAGISIIVALATYAAANTDEDAS